MKTRAISFLLAINFFLLSFYALGKRPPGTIRVKYNNEIVYVDKSPIGHPDRAKRERMGSTGHRPFVEGFGENFRKRQRVFCQKSEIYEDVCRLISRLPNCASAACTNYLVPSVRHYRLSNRTWRKRHSKTPIISGSLMS